MKKTIQHTLYGLLSLILCLAYAQTSAQSKTQAGKSQQIKAGETPQGLQSSEWASIQKQMQLGKYKAYPDGKGGYASANLVQGFQISYQKDGSTTLTPRKSEQDFRVATRLVGIGYAEIQPLPVPQCIEQEELPTGSQVNYTWNENLSEWWTNTEQGLEQWFSIRQAPQGRTAGKPLRLRIALATDMQVSLQNNRLTLRKGNTTLHYDKLRVWDAKGKVLSAAMTYAKGYAELHIAEAEATYPPSL